jgi:hypothetical protein
MARVLVLPGEGLPLKPRADGFSAIARPNNLLLLPFLLSLLFHQHLVIPVVYSGLPG